MSALVFGEADPVAYMEPLCDACGHMWSEHYDGNGTPAQGVPDEMACCWYGWEDYVEGCDCLAFREARKP